MVEPAHVDAAGREALGLVLQCRFERGRGRVPLGLVEKLHPVIVRRARDEGLALAEIALGPADAEARGLDRLDAPLERLRAPGAEREMPHARLLRRRELQRVVQVIVVGAQINRVALARGLLHADHLDEEPQALVGLRRQHFDMRQMRDVVDRFALHVWLLGPLPGAKQDGGGGGIRTHESLAGSPVFKTGAFNHSATPPAPAPHLRECARHCKRRGARWRSINHPRVSSVFSPGSARLLAPVRGIRARRPDQGIEPSQVIATQSARPVAIGKQLRIRSADGA